MTKFGFFRNLKGELCIQNFIIRDLIKEFKTPFFIYDSEILEKNYLSLKNALKHFNGKVHYAIKANDNLGIIKFFANMGSGADVVSIGEMKKCLRAGIDTKNIIFSGVGKEQSDLKYAIGKNIKQINVESEEELEELLEISNKIKKKVNVALRVNLDITPDTHKKISTGDENSKFGISSYKISKLYEIISHSKYLKPFGLAIHIGSQIFDYGLLEKTYKELRDIALNLRKKGMLVSNLDLGGGFGVNYKNFQVQNFKKLEIIIKRVFKNLDFEISVEPGRSLVADSGILVSKIIRTKETSKKRFLIVDAGMNNLIRPTLYNSYHRIEPLFLRKDRPDQKVDVVGPICETGDYFALNRKLQKLVKSEYLVIMTVGAYGSVMSSNYNCRENASEILIYKNRKFLLKQKQTFNKMINSEIIPDF